MHWVAMKGWRAVCWLFSTAFGAKSGEVKRKRSGDHSVTLGLATGVRRHVRYQNLGSMRNIMSTACMNMQI